MQQTDTTKVRLVLCTSMLYYGRVARISFLFDAHVPPSSWLGLHQGAEEREVQYEYEVQHYCTVLYLGTVLL